MNKKELADRVQFLSEENLRKSREIGELDGVLRGLELRVENIQRILERLEGRIVLLEVEEWRG